MEFSSTNSGPGVAVGVHDKRKVWAPSWKSVCPFGRDVDLWGIFVHHEQTSFFCVCWVGNLVQSFCSLLNLLRIYEFSSLIYRKFWLLNFSGWQTSIPTISKFLQKGKSPNMANRLQHLVDSATLRKLSSHLQTGSDASELINKLATHRTATIAQPPPSRVLFAQRN